MTETSVLITATAAPAQLPRSRLRGGDILRVGTVGLRTRPLRAALTALGIGIGIAAMIAVVGISASSRANLIAELDKLGTDLLRAAPGQDLFGDDATLPESARATADRIGPVTDAAGMTYVQASVRRNPLVDPGITGGISVVAADTNLLDSVSGTVATGRYLDQSPSEIPTVVLGADVARRLAITSLDKPLRVWIADRHGNGQWFAVIGILAPAPLAPELDSAALIGYRVAATLFDTTTSPTTLFVRTTAGSVEAVRTVLARSINPEAPNEVDVARPSDALAARTTTDTALRNLLLALGAVALVVGGVGITNVMIISVLERRAEIGVRRALGANRRHVMIQFLAEAALLSLLGGVLGCVLGTVITAGYAQSQQWQLDVPLSSLGAGVTVALSVGLIAGISPAIRAARLDPAEALRPR